MGIADKKLEMLFISNESRGQGMGKKLLEYGVENYSINKLAVNEQNHLAKGFYEHMVIYALSDFLIMILSWLVKQSLRAFLFQEVQP